MKYNITAVSNIKELELKKQIFELNKILLAQPEKVAYLYKNLVTDDTFSFNMDICFYCASSIKFLVCLYLYEEALKNDVILDEVLHLEGDDFRPGSGVLTDKKDEKQDYTIRELIYYCIKESDNSAYLKLVKYVGSQKLKEYGLSLGAKYTLEGKDLFGITNATDMTCYLMRLYEYFNKNTKLSNELKNDMINPSYEIIDSVNIDNKVFTRKYGSFGIAYHEVGIVYDTEPYILIILTQKNELDEKEKKEYINEVAKRINNIHKSIKIYNKSKNI